MPREQNILSEYKALRNEITTRLRIQNEIVAFVIGVIGVLFGFAIRESTRCGVVFEESIMAWIFLAIPLLTLGSGFLLIASANRIKEIGIYIKTNIESNIDGLGWEKYIKEEEKKRPIANNLYKLAIILLFIVITLVSIILAFRTYNNFFPFVVIYIIYGSLLVVLTLAMVESILMRDYKIWSKKGMIKFWNWISKRKGTV